MILMSCQDNQVIPQKAPDFEPIVYFEFTMLGSCSEPILEVVFENKSVGPDSYLWDFGDGTFSNRIHPRKVFSKWGTYHVNLTATTSGVSKQIEKEIFIPRSSDGSGPTGQLTGERSSPTNHNFTFHITTDEPSYMLDFGDATTPLISGASEVFHAYAGPGKYRLSLYLLNSNGHGCAELLIGVNP